MGTKRDSDPCGCRSVRGCTLRAGRTHRALDRRRRAVRHRRSLPDPLSPRSAHRAMSCMVEPAIALTVQGVKHAVLGDDVYRYDKHRFLLTTLDLPVVLQAVEASPSNALPEPRAEARRAGDRGACHAEQGAASGRESPMARGIVLGETTTRMLETFDRLVQLLDEPAAAPVLAPLIHKEIYYRLLAERAGLAPVAAGHGGQPRPPRRACDRVAQVALRRRAASRRARRSGADEPVAVPSPLPPAHRHEPAAVPEASSAQRSTSTDADRAPWTPRPRRTKSATKARRSSAASTAVSSARRLARTCLGYSALGTDGRLAGMRFG